MEETIGLIDKTGGKAMFVHTDVSVMDECQRLVSSAVERFGGLHILHNDAFWSDHNHTVVELRGRHVITGAFRASRGGGGGNNSSPRERHLDGCG